MSRSPLKPWLQSPCPEWVTPHLDSGAKRRGQQHCPRATRQSAGRRPRLATSNLYTTCHGSADTRGQRAFAWNFLPWVIFSSVKRSTARATPLPCKGPYKFSQGVCAKGCHAAPESLGSKQLDGHGGLLSDSLINCVAVNGGIRGFSMQPIWPPPTPVFLWGKVFHITITAWILEPYRPGGQRQGWNVWTM